MSYNKEGLQPSYQPNPQILENYADVFVNFALNSGQGIRPGEVVHVACPDVAKPLLLPLQESILKAGGNMHLQYLPSGLGRSFHELASNEQLDFLSLPYEKARIDLIDHTIRVIAE